MIKISDQPIGHPDQASGARRYTIDISGEYTVGQLIEDLISWNDETGHINVRHQTKETTELVDTTIYMNGGLDHPFRKPETTGMRIDNMHCYAEIGAFGNPKRVDYELMV